MISLFQIIQEILSEEKADRCLRIARQKYDKPSAYRSGAIVRCRKGDIWKDLKEGKEPSIQDLAYQQIPGLLERGIEDELKFLSDAIDGTLEDVKNTTNPQLKRVALSTIVPSQSEEDYQNASSEAQAQQFEKMLSGEKDVQDHRKDDFYPILVDRKTNKIVDGNHRHYALSAINSPYAVVLYVDVPTEYLNEDESLRKWFSRKGAKGKSKGWVDCNAPDGKGGYKSCGRQEGEKRSKYPACRPTPAQCKTKGKGKDWGKTK